jgi:NAD-dependent dihydropyrimidine dehydrogenase PreA subunit
MIREHRPRQAPRAEPTSDVTRFRGVGLAALCGAAVAAALALALSSAGATTGAPGPLPLPHRRAGLTCSSCHADGDRVRADACVGCHGAHPSTRAPHRRLAGAGLLACADCHAGHGHNTGVVFSPAGGALRYGPGGEVVASAAPLFRPRAELTVPIVSAGACARCHDLASPRDPIGDCLLAGHESLGRDRPTVCFDEHRPAGAESGAAASRSAAWEAAREVAAAVPLAPALATAPALARLGLWLGLAALGSLLTWTGFRAVDRSRRRTRTRRARERDLAGGATSPAPARLPVVNASTCLGCYACVDACPYDVLEIRRYVAAVARPTDCCGLTLCEQKCPNGSLVMADRAVAAPAAEHIDALESREVPGLFLAGDVTGVSLIRNAINQGALAVRAIAAERAAGSRATPGDPLDLVIVGAGPAGLSASLEARASRAASPTASAASRAASWSSTRISRWSAACGWPRPARKSCSPAGCTPCAASSRPFARASGSPRSSARRTGSRSPRCRPTVVPPPTGRAACSSRSAAAARPGACRSTCRRRGPIESTTAWPTRAASPAAAS